MLVSVGVTWVTDQLLADAAWRSLSYEASTLCLYAGVLVWYALRRRAHAVKLALGVYLVLVALAAAADVLTKLGMTSAQWDSLANRDNPRLMWGALMFLPLG